MSTALLVILGIIIGAAAVVIGFYVWLAKTFA